MPPEKPHDERLAELRQWVAQERSRQRELAAAVENAKRKVEDCGLAIQGAYAVEDEALAQQCRQGLREAEKGFDLQDRLSAAELRLEAAEREANDFEREHAKELLAELESEALAIASESNRWAAQGTTLKPRWTTHQKRVDELVALVPEASPR